MLDTSLGFSLMVSTIITVIIYVVTRDKKLTEYEKKDKLNDTIIIFIITFIVVLFGKIFIGDSSNSLSSSSSSTTLMKINDIKGGQCPF